MRKHYFGRQLKRDTNERKALFKSLLSELVLHERIRTTEEKAKAIKADADKLITKAMKADRLHAYALLQPLVTPQAVRKLIIDLAPRFADRHGGYTRIMKLGQRFSDNANMAVIEWVENKSAVKSDKSKRVTNSTSDSQSTIASSAKTTTRKKTISKKKVKEEIKA